MGGKLAWTFNRLRLVSLYHPTDSHVSRAFLETHIFTSDVFWAMVMFRSTSITSGRGSSSICIPIHYAAEMVLMSVILCFVDCIVYACLHWMLQKRPRKSCIAIVLYRSAFVLITLLQICYMILFAANSISRSAGTIGISLIASAFWFYVAAAPVECLPTLVMVRRTFASRADCETPQLDRLHAEDTTPANTEVAVTAIQSASKSSQHQRADKAKKVNVQEMVGNSDEAQSNVQQTDGQTGKKKKAAPKDGGKHDMTKREGKGDALQSEEGNDARDAAAERKQDPSISRPKEGQRPEETQKQNIAKPARATSVNTEVAVTAIQSAWRSSQHQCADKAKKVNVQEMVENSDEAQSSVHQAHGQTGKKKKAAPKGGGNKNMMKKEGKGDAVQKKGPDKQNIVVKVDEADVDDGWGSEDPFYHLQRQRRFKHDLPKAEGADDQGQSPDKNKIKIYMKKKAEGTGDETQKKAKDPNKDQSEQTGKSAEAVQNMHGKEKQKKAKDPNNDQSEKSRPKEGQRPEETQKQNIAKPARATSVNTEVAVTAIQSAWRSSQHQCADKAKKVNLQEMVENSDEAQSSVHQADGQTGKKKKAAPKGGGNKNMMKKEGKGDAVQKKGPDKHNIVVKVDEADVDDG